MSIKARPEMMQGQSQGVQGQGHGQQYKTIRIKPKDESASNLL